MKPISKTETVTTTTTFNETLGKLLRAEREVKGLTQVEMGAKLGLINTPYLMWESGIIPMSVEQFADACEIIGIGAAGLLSVAIAEHRG